MLLDTAAASNANTVSQPAKSTAAPLNAGVIGQAAASFHALHAQRFGYANAQEPVEVTAVRLLTVGNGDRETGRQGDKETKEVNVIQNPKSEVQMRKVYVEEGWGDASLFQRDTLEVGQTFSGPALVLQEDATTYVAPGWNARVDAHANLILQAVPK